MSVSRRSDCTQGSVGAAGSRQGLMRSSAVDARPWGRLHSIACSAGEGLMLQSLQMQAVDHCLCHCLWQCNHWLCAIVLEKTRLQYWVCTGHGVGVVAASARPASSATNCTIAYRSWFVFGRRQVIAAQHESRSTDHAALESSENAAALTVTAGQPQ